MKGGREEEAQEAKEALEGLKARGKEQGRCARS